MAIVKVLLFVVATTTLAVLIPKYTVHDSIKLNEVERACAIRDTYLMLDNPIVQLFMLKTVVEKKEGNAIYTASYTFFGLKLVQVKLVCNEGSTVVWSRWFNNNM
ncbi:MAG: hypothetical protein COA83_00835 [Methylophaga sp.]|nr:MAG: hypothetical protein COA83_00835 [Methylophaga sp.]